MVTYAHARVVDKQKHLHFTFEYEHRFSEQPASEVAGADGKERQTTPTPKDSDSGPLVKQFSFKRSMDEKVGKFLDRLKLNLNTFLMDKLNKRQLKLIKKSKKVQPEVPESNLTNTSPTNQSLIDQLEACLQQLKANQVAVELLLDDRPADRELLNGQVFAADEPKQLRLCVGLHSYDIVLNAPYIKSFKMPKLILAQHPVFALLTIELGHALDCEYRWYRRRGKQKWELVSQEFYYIPNTVGDQIKVEVVHRTGDRINFEAEHEAKDVVQPAPRESPFLLRHKLTEQPTTGSGQFRCVSYNMLADFYADSDYSRTVLFPYCPPQFLSIDYRQHLLLKELVGYNGDLICLQEVDKSFFNHSLAPFLKAKQRLHGELCLKAGNLSEGLATFYNEKKFRLLEQQRHVFTELIADDPLFDDIRLAIETNEQLSKRIDLKTVFHVSVLESLQVKDRLLLVINTHLYSKADADHIRLLQASIILRHLERLQRKWSESHPQVSTVVMGDFNSTPEFGVYRLFTVGHAETTSEDWKSSELILT